MKEQKDEDIEQRVQTLFKDDLGIRTNIDIEKVHRLGKFSNFNLKEPRNVIIRFNNMRDRDLVWSKKSSLKGKPYVIHEDFSRETEYGRRQLYPYAKAARQAGAQSSLKGDVLYINKRPYTAETVNNIPAEFHPKKLATQSTDSMTLFYGKFSEFSNFFPSDFVIDGTKFANNEQFYQSKKAEYFEADDIASKIKNTSDPFHCYKLGSKIPNFNQEQWDKVQFRIMTEGLNAKFSQNTNLKTILLNTGGNVIAECSRDKTWGIGLPISHPNIKNADLWSGKNLLGQSLMNVRRILKNS